MANPKARPGATKKAKRNRMLDLRGVMQIPLSLLFLDPDRQRGLHEPHVKGLIKDWEINTFMGAVVAEQPDGTYVVVEGQHSIEAARRMSDEDGIPWDEQLIWCFVLPPEHTGIEEELAVAGRMRRLKHNQQEQWDNRLGQGEEPEVRCVRMLANHGLVMGGGTNAHTVRCPGKVKAIIRRDGLSPAEAVEAFERTIVVLTSAWAPDDQKKGPHRLDAAILSAMDELIRRNPHIDLSRLIKKLAEHYPDTLRNESVPKGLTKAQVIAEYVMKGYNTRLSAEKKLSW